MALPNKTFWVNYNARNYNPTTLTIPKENGQLFDNDLVFPSAATFNDDHITISDDKRVVFNFNSNADNIFNRTTNTATLTFVAKLGGTDNTWFVSNRHPSVVGWMLNCGTFTYMAYTGDDNRYTFQQTNPKIFTWRCGNGTQQYICQTDNVVGTPYNSTAWVGNETNRMTFFGGEPSNENWTGDFYWLYISPETLTDAEIQAVIDYNENPQTPLVQIPINKYKLYTSNIQKTYNGSTQINKMYVGSNLVYRALPTTTGPQLTIPLDEVWYKSSTNSNWNGVSGAYFMDANGNQLTYTTTLDTDTGLMKMKFSGNVAGYHSGADSFNLTELYLPQGFVYADDSFLYGNTDFKKFYGDSPSIQDGGNVFINLKQGDSNYNALIETAKDISGSITVPEGITKLGYFSFKNTKATNITLPSTLTYIGRMCFEQIIATNVYCYATTPPSQENNIWWSVSVAGTFHYPAGSDYSSFTVPSNWTKVGDL